MGDSKDERKLLAEENVAPVSLAKLFRFATCSDVLMMLLGTMAAFLHGSAFPVAMAVFGEITNAFINNAKTSTLLPLLLCLSDGTVSNFTLISVPPTNCSELFALAADVNLTCVNYSDILKSFGGSGTLCLPDDPFTAEINRLVYVFIGIAGLAFLCGVIQMWCIKVPAVRQTQKLRLKLYACFLHKDLGWFDLNDTGAMSSSLSNGVETVHEAIGENIAILVQWLSTFLAAIGISLYVQYQLALLLLAIVPFMGLAGFCFTKLGGVFSKLEQKFFARAGCVAQEVLPSITTVQVYGGEEREQSRFEENLKQTRRFGVYKGLAIGSSVGMIYFLIFLVYSVSFWFGAFLVSKGLAELGDVITVFFSILIGAFYLGQSGPNMQKLAEAQAAAATIYRVIDMETEIDASSDRGIVPDHFDPTVKFNTVTFKFPARPKLQVLNGLDVEVMAGEKVALVGTSGSGKSTVIKLIQRLYDASSGEVCVGGVSVKDLNLKWLRGHIGVVSQEPVLFDTTIAENIALGKDDATLEEVQGAAKKANAHNFIASLPKGYDTEVGEGGAQLSGGQKQRIAIARALVRDPRILLLDEATSALDTESEKIVQEALDKAMEGRTTITIAHRLSTIRDASVIICMQSGRVVETGTHAQLMQAEGKYFDLVNAQAVQAPAGVVREKQKRRFHSASVEQVGRPRSSTVNTGSEALLSHSTALGKSLVLSGGRRKKSGSRISSSTRRNTGGESSTTPIIGDDSSASLTLSQNQIEQSEEMFDVSYKMLEEESESREEDEKVASISFFKLFSLNLRMLPVVLLGCLGAAINGLIFPAFSVIFGEVVQIFSRPPGQILSGIHPYAAAFLGLGVVSAICIFDKFVCFNISGFNLASVVRSLLFKAFLRQDKAWYDREENSTGSLTSLLAVDALLVQGVAGIRVGSLLEVLISLVAALAVAFAYSWMTALVILGFMPMVVLASIFHYSIASNNQARSLEARSESTQVAVESINAIQTVQSFGLEDLYYARFSALSKPPYRKALRLSFLTGVTYSLSQVIVFFAYIITFRFGAFQVVVPEESVAHAQYQNVYRAFSAIIFVSIGIGAVGAFIPDASKANAAVDKVFKVINRPLTIDPSSREGETSLNVSGMVQFNSVSFSYPRRKEVTILDYLNLTVERCSTVGLVGGSGSGKSTIMTLLQRFYDPSHGSVSLDGTDIRHLNLKWFRSQIGMVAQEPVLFDGTIADNIRYGALFREVSDDEVASAAVMANIHDFIATLPKGYNTNVGAKGTQLSGGQKQRIAIARALVRDPRILLLDEATSALDTESEKIVQEALDKARKGRTTIIIAHRLSTIQNADKIVILKNGKVAEEGCHSALLQKQDGLYYRMVYHQHRAWRADSDLSSLSRPSLEVDSQ